MKRAGCLLFAALPVVITAGVYALTPTHSHDGTSKASASPSRSAAPHAATDAKRGAEREKPDGDQVIAGLPAGLAAPAKKELAQELVASAENSTLDWRSAYGYVEDIGDGQGYTAGTVGFCTGTHDLLTLVERYTKAHPGNGLARYLPALHQVDGTDSHKGLDPGFTAAWKAEAEAARLPQGPGRGTRPRLLRPGGPPRQARRPRHTGPVHLLRRHGLPRSGHGLDGFYGLRERAMREADTPSRGGSEKNYLDIFLDIRVKAMKTKRPGIDTSRVDTAQRRFLYDGNLDLKTPLTWQVYGETYKVP